MFFKQVLPTPTPSSIHFIVLSFTFKYFKPWCVVFGMELHSFIFLYIEIFPIWRDSIEKLSLLICGSTWVYNKLRPRGSGSRSSLSVPRVHFSIFASRSHFLITLDLWYALDLATELDTDSYIFKEII